MITIYALIDPLTDEARYVGKTSNSVEKRLAMHLASKTSRACSQWVQSLKSQGLKPTGVELEYVEDKAGSSEAEMFWISYLKFLGADLTNAVGNGYRPCDVPRRDQPFCGPKRFSYRRLRDFRTARGVPLESLARKMRLPYRVIENWESGTCTPSLPELDRIGKILGVTGMFFITASE